MTIVIPYANNPTDFSVLLMQLQMQKVRPDAIYVADNSSDGSGFEIVKRYQFSVPIVVEQNVGTIYESWNRGIEFAHGDDVVILNDDVLIPFDFCEVMQVFLESESAHIYCPATQGFPPVRSVRRHYKWMGEEKLDLTVAIEETHTHTPTITGWCFALPKETIYAIGLFDKRFEIWYGDKDYEKRLLQLNGSIGFIHGLPVHHYGTSSYSKIKKKTFNSRNYQDQIAYEKKYDLEHLDLGWDKYAQ